VAWFTAVGNTPRVKVTFSDDAGVTFREPVIVDDGSPSGRVDVVLLDDGNAMVSWLERAAGGGEVRVRRVESEVRIDQSTVIAPAGTARSSGFPRMARSGNLLVFAWTGKKVLTSVLRLP